MTSERVCDDFLAFFAPFSRLEPVCYSLRLSRHPQPAMTVFTLKAKNDHLQKVASTRDYIKAISEFVWNALDADATAVSVEFLRKMEEKNGPVRQAFFQCGSTAYENYGTANSRIRLDWDKYQRR